MRKESAVNNGCTFRQTSRQRGNRLGLSLVLGPYHCTLLGAAKYPHLIIYRRLIEVVLNGAQGGPLASNGFGAFGLFFDARTDDPIPLALNANLVLDKATPYKRLDQLDLFDLFVSEALHNLR
ncbi:hypothetical protein [Roseobacter sp. EG26]|uniref:hypothetical protein n=1 Tax=Roseobacter sp. EG26 TaxID=3412477 RepID=UPI003CE52A54